MSNLMGKSECANRLTPENLLYGLSSSELQSLSKYGRFTEYSDELLVEDGVKQNSIFIILKGEVEIFKYKQSLTDGKLTKQSFCILKDGDCFGEMSFLSGGNATASAYSLGSSNIWQISHNQLEHFIKNEPGGSKISLNLAKVLSNRLDGSNQKVLNLSQELSDFIQIKSKESSNETALQTVQSIETRLESLQKAYGLGHKSEEVSRFGFYFAIFTSVIFAIFSFYAHGQLSDTKRALEEKSEANELLIRLDQYQKQELKSLNEKNEKIWINSQKILSSYLRQLSDLQGATNEISSRLANQNPIENTVEAQNIREHVNETKAILSSNQDIINTLNQLHGENVELRKIINSKNEPTTPSNRYAIIRKAAVRGSLIDHPYKKDTHGNPIQVQVPSAYFFYCLSERTRTFITFEVSEIDYVYYQKGEVIKSVIASAWKNIEYFPSKEDLSRNYFEQLIITEKRSNQKNYEYGFDLNPMPIQESYVRDDPETLYNRFFKDISMNQY